MHFKYVTSKGVFFLDYCYLDTLSLENAGLGSFPFKLNFVCCGGVIAASENMKGVDGLCLYILGALLGVSCIIKNVMLQLVCIFLWSPRVCGSCACSVIFWFILLQQYSLPFNS